MFEQRVDFKKKFLYGYYLKFEMFAGFCRYKTYFKNHWTDIENIYMSILDMKRWDTW